MVAPPVGYVLKIVTLMVATQGMKDYFFFLLQRIRVRGEFPSGIL